MKKTIFLDFDGVLHGEGRDSKGQFEHIPLFCETIRPFISNLQIVISSSWRETHSIEKLRIFFEHDIKPLIIGVTPVHVNGFNYGGREQEIREYCSIHNILDTYWIALDDMERLFSPECKNVIFVDSEYGLSFGEVKALEYFLKK